MSADPADVKEPCPNCDATGWTHRFTFAQLDVCDLCRPAYVNTDKQIALKLLLANFETYLADGSRWSNDAWREWQMRFRIQGLDASGSADELVAEAKAVLRHG